MRDRENDLFGWGPEDNQYPYRPGYKGHLSTGREAARRIAPAVNGIRRRVLDAFCEAWPRGMSPDEAASKLGLSILTVRPRCAELRRLELLEATAQRQTNSSGHSATVLRASEKGRAE